jgi:transcriptional regulator with XRE-family HTH domain
MRRIDPTRVLRDVGRRVADIRVERALTQDELAEAIGISTKYLQRIERGRNMNLVTLIDLANRLNVDLPALLLVRPKSPRRPRVGRPPRRG